MRGLQIAGLIFVSYAIVSVNTCAIARARYVPTMASSAAFMVVNYFLIRHVAAARSSEEFLGYLVGGVLGDLAGIWISKKANIL